MLYRDQGRRPGGRARGVERRRGLTSGRDPARGPGGPRLGPPHARSSSTSCSEAGVVDAGGLGVAVILDGLVRRVTGQEIAVDLRRTRTAAPDLDSHPRSARRRGATARSSSSRVHRRRERVRGAHPRDRARAFSSSPTSDLVKVHLHTQDPGAALTYAVGFGRLAGVKVEDMEAQVRERATGEQASKSGAPVHAGSASWRRAGGRETARSSSQMGAVVVEGGQGANPSAADLRRAVEETGSSRRRAVAEQQEHRARRPSRSGSSSRPRCTSCRRRASPPGLAVMVGYDRREASPRRSSRRCARSPTPCGAPRLRAPSRAPGRGPGGSRGRRSSGSSTGSWSRSEERCERPRLVSSPRRSLGAGRGHR